LGGKGRLNTPPCRKRTRRRRQKGGIDRRSAATRRTVNHAAIDRSGSGRPVCVRLACMHGRARAKAMHRVCIQLPIGVAHWLWAQKSSCMRKECDQVTVHRSWRSTYVLRLGALADACSCSTQVIKHHAHLCLRTQEWLARRVYLILHMTKFSLSSL
jgi:hypothetical protein